MKIKKSQLRQVVREYVRNPKNEEQLEAMINNNLNEGWQAILGVADLAASLLFLPLSIGMGAAASGPGMDYDVEDDKAAAGLGSS